MTANPQVPWWPLRSFKSYLTGISQWALTGNVEPLLKTDFIDVDWTKEGVALPASAAWECLF